jgi:hypothetical protein
MKVTFFTWENARRTLQELFGRVAMSSRTEVFAPSTANTAFRVPHALPLGIAPNSVSGTPMAAGYIYYTEADRNLWSANQNDGDGAVYVRCSVASAKCEIRVSAYDS